MQFHVSDPPFSTAFGNARINFYNIPLTPTNWFDGTLETVGIFSTVEQQKTWYLDQINERRGEPTDIAIELFASLTSDRNYTIETILHNEGGATRTMRVHTVQVLDNWPGTGGYHRNGHKEAAPSIDVTLAPGESMILSNAITVDTQSWGRRQDIKFISWAQEITSSGPAEVFNAARIGDPLAHGCLKGTVNLGAAGAPTPVLRINGEHRELTVTTSTPLTVSMAAAPAGPASGNYAVYVYLQAPDETTVQAQPKQLGDFCFPSTILGGSQTPAVIFNNIGKPARLGTPDFPTTPAPSDVISIPNGVGMQLTATFAGFLLDNGSAADVPASITNGVVLHVE